MIKISIMMPVYNGEKYLAEAIDSIRSQSLQEWELVIINDGSTDRTVEIVNSYSDNRIVLVQQQNAGEGAARNTALDHAAGEYLAFLDADDMYYPDAFASSARYLDQHPDLMVVYSDGYYCDERGTPLRQFSASRSKNHEGFVLGELAVSPFHCATCSVIIRKSAVDQRSIRFDPELNIGTDWNFLLELARYYPYGYNPEITCRYRIHGDNITYTYHQKRKEYIGKIRLRILNLPEFFQFNSEIKNTLLYQLLLETFTGDFTSQQEVMKSYQFMNLPEGSQARLMRLVASSGIRQGTIPGKMAAHLYEQSIQLAPTDWKTRVVFRLFKVSPKAIKLVLSLKNKQNISQPK